LIIEQKRIVTSGEIKRLARELGKDEDRSLYYLQEEGYIVRIFRGIFYVKTIDEREQGTIGTSIYNMVALALKEKGVNKWYFGLETALKMNDMTHEYFTIDYVLTDSYRTTRIIRIHDTRFQFYQRSVKQFQKGIIKKGLLRYSDRERTVLDLAYKRYIDTKDADYFLQSIKEYRNNIERRKVKKYLSIYPPSFHEKVEGFL